MVTDLFLSGLLVYVGILGGLLEVDLFNPI